MIILTNREYPLSLNTLLVKALLSMGQLSEGGTYDVDFDHQFIETEKYDANPRTSSSSATGPVLQ